MSKVIRAVTHLNQANIEYRDSEKCPDSKTGTGTSSTAKEDVNWSSVTEETAYVPRRSKRVRKDLRDQVMSTQETSVVARNDMDTGATERVPRKRKCKDVSFNAGTDLPPDASRINKRSTWKQISFEERYEQLLALKDEFGHCFVPTRYPIDPSLARWCQGMRYTYNQIQQGKPTTYALSQDRIARLEAIGFKWK